MNLMDAMDAIVSRAEAKAEIRRHWAENVEGNNMPGRGFEDYWADFILEVGDKDEYEGCEVLGWLGY